MVGSDKGRTAKTVYITGPIFVRQGLQTASHYLEDECQGRLGVTTVTHRPLDS